MNDRDQNIAVAEFHGFTVEIKESNGIQYTVLLNPDGSFCDSSSGVGTLENFGCLRKYGSDLNAMHQVESILPNRLWQTYTQNLGKITGTVRFCVAHATAAQRREALLRTIGKWRDA